MKALIVNAIFHLHFEGFHLTSIIQLDILSPHAVYAQLLCTNLHLPHVEYHFPFQDISLQLQLPKTLKIFYYLSRKIVQLMKKIHCGYSIKSPNLCVCMRCWNGCGIFFINWWWNWWSILIVCIFFSRRALNTFSLVYQPIFTVVFAWSLITICGSMLMVQMEIVSYYSIITMYSIYEFINTFFFFSNLVTP